MSTATASPVVVVCSNPECREHVGDPPTLISCPKCGGRKFALADAPRFDADAQSPAAPSLKILPPGPTRDALQAFLDEAIVTLRRDMLGLEGAPSSIGAIRIRAFQDMRRALIGEELA